MHILLAFLLSLLPYVNPFVGTDAHGHTFPGAVAPFGQIQLSPDTRPQAGDWDGCSGYHYSDAVIYGFSHTHLSGTGCDDWCDVLVTPGGEPSRFSHKREQASPGFYQVYLDDTHVLVQLLAGRRSALHDYTFMNGSALLTVDLKHRDPLEAYELNVDGNRCYGYRISNSWAHGQQVHFYLEFSSPVSESRVDGEKATLLFRETHVQVRVGISSVSWENARDNLKQEWPEDLTSFRKKTEEAWEAYLAKVECPYQDTEHKRRFYTALYHTAIHPSLYSDANGEYRGMDGKVHKTQGWERYTVFSTWDTFRGLHPLLTEIEPERTVDFIRSMLSIYKEQGKLPIWELSGYETNCMIGYNSAPILADAIVRGLPGFNYEEAFRAMLASARNKEFGLDSFRKNGLVLSDDEHESVSKTLEYAYDDWCVAQVALKLGHMAEYKEFMQSAQYWKNVLDPDTLFMRARRNGHWVSPFDPREVNNHYTEANSWQYSFFVPHDIAGLIDALGGPEAFEARLDALFSAPKETTGRKQADITGLIGQYAHGNEPSHHIAYLYDAIGKTEKREARVKEILEKLYSSKPDGLCGNDDCGQMSAWYVLSSLGKYPVCPGAPLGTTLTSMENTLVRNPAFVMENDMFKDSLTVALEGPGKLFYTVAGGPARRYEGPFTLMEACELTAWAEENGRKSFITRSRVRQVKKDCLIQLLAQYSRQYTAGGDEGLIDGTRGSTNWRTGGWQGYQGTDFEAVLDLMEVRNLDTLGVGFLQDARSWIWMPRYVEFSGSLDGKYYTPLGRLESPVAERDETIQIWNAELPVKFQARYIKVHAAPIGIIPSWHPGAGAPAFIFVDEVWAHYKPSKQHSKLVTKGLSIWERMKQPNPKLETEWIYQPENGFGVGVGYELTQMGVSLNSQTKSDGGTTASFDFNLEPRNAHRLQIKGMVGPISAGYSYELNKKERAARTMFFNYLASHYGAQFQYNRYDANILYKGILRMDDGAEENIGNRFPSDKPARLYNLIVDGFYAFNSHRFAYTAAYTGKLLQRRSAGSWLVSLKYMQGDIRLEPDDNTTFFLQGLGWFTTYQLSVGGGYSFNWVLYHRDPASRSNLHGLRNVTLNVTATPTLSLFNRVVTRQYERLDEIGKPIQYTSRVADSYPIDSFGSPNFIARAGLHAAFGHFYLTLWTDYTFFYFVNGDKEFKRGSGLVKLSQRAGFSTFKLNLELNYRF